MTSININTIVDEISAEFEQNKTCRKSICVSGESFEIILREYEDDIEIGKIVNSRSPPIECKQIVELLKDKYNPCYYFVIRITCAGDRWPIRTYKTKESKTYKYVGTDVYDENKIEILKLESNPKYNKDYQLVEKIVYDGQEQLKVKKISGQKLLRIFQFPIVADDLIDGKIMHIRDIASSRSTLMIYYQVVQPDYDVIDLDHKSKNIIDMYNHYNLYGILKSCDMN